MISIDTGILLAILRGEKGHRQSDVLSLGSKYRLAICDAAFAELCTAFQKPAEAEHFLSDHSIHISMPSSMALCEAGRRFKAYLKKRKSLCPSCKKPVPYRGTTAVDFLVGALGLVDGSGIMSNDRQIRRIWKEANFF
jgi:predicted nucleic acid-binding protein